MSRTKLHDSGSDVRDDVDDYPIRNGDQLLLWQDGAGMQVRYEASLPGCAHVAASCLGVVTRHQPFDRQHGQAAHSSPR